MDESHTDMDVELQEAADVPTPSTPRQPKPSGFIEVEAEAESAAAASPTSPFRRQYSWALSFAEDTNSTVRLYAWGRNDTGQLGCGTDSSQPEPTPNEALKGRDIVTIDGSSFNSAFVTGDGGLFTAGSGESGQLGRKAQDHCTTATRVDALDNFNVQHVACGEAHMLAIVDNGNIASWGSADFGQLGHGEEASSTSHPRIIKGGGAHREHFVRVAAGANHSMALTGSGQVYAFGDGSFGALGHGDVRNRYRPSLVTRLWPLGITQIACGDSHSCALAHDGRVFCWGRGKYGQVGVGSFDNATLPQHVRMAFVCQQVSCGGDHTVALARGGEVLSWGRGTWGQTGHGTTDNIARPRHVQALQEHRITQVSAGARHTLAMSSQAAFGWGCASEGQLGQQATDPVLVPQHIRSLPMRPPMLYLVAAGDHCFSAAGEMRHLTRTMSGSAPREHGVGMWPLRLPSLMEMATRAANVPAAKPQMQMLMRAVEDMFASPAFLAAQIHLQLEPSEDRQDQAAPPTMDLKRIDQLYTALLKVYSADLVQAMGSACERLLRGMLDAITRAQDPATPTPHLQPLTWAQILFILLQSPLNGESQGRGHVLLRGISQAAASLPQADKHLLSGWLERLPAEVLAARNVRPVHGYLGALVQHQGPRSELLCGLHLLMLMFLANKAGERGATIPNAEFYNTTVSKGVNLQEEFLLWVQHKHESSRRKKAGQSRLTELVSLCQVPFILTPQAKCAILQGEALLHKQNEVQNSGLQALMHGMHPSMAAFLDIQVRRGHEMEDALNQIVHRPTELKKPLRVSFAGEEGVDQGGVTKEFFQLLIRAIFNENYGMFKYDHQTRTFWFNWTTMESDLEFALVGMVLGLAIYNGVILDVHFPLLVYKKLLGRPVGLQDLEQGFPELAKGLQQLLNYPGEDVESVFTLSFEIEYDYFGEMRSHELRPGGSQEPVTEANRQEYVQLYTEWVLNRSIQRQFEAFSQGFHQVCGGFALGLFRHEELELLVCGLPHLDFEGLQKAARYDGGYSDQHPTIQAFWHVISSLSLEQKKHFLFFTTGCDRAPVGGLEELSLVLQRSGPDTDRLPTAHTCFNVLLLPEYSSEAKLRTCLTTAIENAEGFGLQ